jgi:hypothetical protein
MLRKTAACWVLKAVEYELTGLFDSLVVSIGQVLGQYDGLPDRPFVVASVKFLGIAPVASFLLFCHDLGNDSSLHDLLSDLVTSASLLGLSSISVKVGSLSEGLSFSSSQSVGSPNSHDFQSLIILA